MNLRINKILSAFICAALLLCLAGCGSAKDTGYPVKAGGITLENAPAKVVCLSASAEEAVRFLAGGEIIAGVSGESDADNSLPRVGTFAAPAVDKITSLDCDLVITGSPLPEEYSQKLALAKIPVAVIPVPEKYDDLQKYYEDFAALLFGNKQKAEKAETAMKPFKILNARQNPVKALITPASGVYATPETVMGRLLTCAGFSNVITGSDFKADDAALSAALPEVIFCAEGMKAAVAALPALAGSPAVQNGQIYEVNEKSLRLPGNKFAAVIGEMAQHAAPAQSETTVSGE